MKKHQKTSTFKQRVSEASGGAEIVKVDRNAQVTPDHRERPNSEYSEEFINRVVSAAQMRGARLTWVGLRFNVLPEIVKNWVAQYSK
jgi:transposase-like protein